MIPLRPSSITEHHSVSSLIDLACEASPCSRHLRPARDQDTTSVGGNCSRIDGDKRTERIEPPSDSPGASVDPTEVRNVSGSGPEDWAVRRDGIAAGSVPSRPARLASHPGGAMEIVGRYAATSRFFPPLNEV